MDLGCATHGEDESIDALIARFRPDHFYGFDPFLGAEVHGHGFDLYPTAAWLHDGTVQYERNGIRSAVLTGGSDVECFDLAAFLRSLAADELVVKLDVEGAEYPLLRELHRTGVDERITLLLVEWHSDERVEMACPVEEWDHQSVAA